MPQGRQVRKRPCRVCRKWFSPNPRVGERQKTCGDKVCQQQWHTKQCARWNRENSAYFREIYLSRKLAAATANVEVTQTVTDIFPDDPPIAIEQSSKSSALPINVIQEVIGAQHLVIIEYLVRLLFRAFQDEMRGQLLGITAKSAQLPAKSSSRGDSPKRGP